jgi:hypothetical protein
VPDLLSKISNVRRDHIDKVVSGRWRHPQGHQLRVTTNASSVATGRHIYDWNEPGGTPQPFLTTNHAGAVSVERLMLSWLERGSVQAAPDRAPPCLLKEHGGPHDPPRHDAE